MKFNLKSKLSNSKLTSQHFETIVQKYRYERKFVINELNVHEIELQLKLHPALFSEIYHERSVNNIYFDGIDFNNYLSNVIGISQRKKIRIRWYGELFGTIQKPVLEIKNKHGHLGVKESYRLPHFVLNRNIKKCRWNEIFCRSDIPESLKLELKFTNPTLINSYSRKYFLSHDKKVRVTIDKKLRYYFIINGKEHSDSSIILEIKYNYSEKNNINRITDYLNFRLTKNSKYVNGIKSQYYLNDCLT